MIGGLARTAWPLLRCIDPERSHELSLRALELGLHPHTAYSDDAVLHRTLWQIAFPNPIGIAAGFDKDARVPDPLLKLGFGFVEVGTVTPLPQSGNPKPRIFRLPDSRAVINRLGFNNNGHDAAIARLEARPPAGIVGVNIGANAKSEDRIGDYETGLDVFSDVADYIVVNISSPNTAQLRDLQAPDALDTLLKRLMVRREQLADAGRRRPPMVVKLAPDIAEADLPLIVERLLHHAVDGISVSNTTIARDTVANEPLASEAGGLSGAPLFDRATRMLAQVCRLTGGDVPLIGIGGIDSGTKAVEKIAAGASLIQLYTGLTYAGPSLIDEIKLSLTAALKKRGLASVADLTGQDVDRWLEP